MAESRDDQALLRVEGLTKKFGGVTALNEITLEVAQHEIVGLIGPNGAGKTTFFNLISGNMPQDRGKIYFEGRDCTRLKPFQRCRLGISRTYQTVRPFLDFSVEENMLIGLQYGRRAPSQDRSIRAEHGTKILELLGLERKRRQLARNLTLVDRKLVEVARALATGPKLLLLDEVLSGLNPAELEDAVKLIRKLSASFGLTIIWIEHIMQALLKTCDRFVVFHYGSKLLEGSPEAVVSDPRVIEAYLGRGAKKVVRMPQDDAAEGR
jgi:branched-chain amino acid transport system ATP-binding protein